MIQCGQQVGAGGHRREMNGVEEHRHKAPHAPMLFLQLLKEHIIRGTHQFGDFLQRVDERVARDQREKCRP
jgi:hypothetical protein